MIKALRGLLALAIIVASLALAAAPADAGAGTTPSRALPANISWE